MHAAAAADEFRQRCNGAMQKIFSLRVVVNERTQQYREMTTVNRTRPKTAFMRTPKYILTLFDTISTSVEDIKVLYRTRLADVSSKSDRVQFLGLITDLERELDKLSGQLELRNPPASIPSGQQESIPDQGDSSATTSSSFTAADDEESKQETAHEDIATRRTIFPSIHTTNGNNSIELRHLSVGSRTQTRAMMLRLEMMKHPPTYSFVQRSMQGYPYGSSFPKLEPCRAPKRRRSRLIPKEEENQ